VAYRKGDASLRNYLNPGTDKARGGAAGDLPAKRGTCGVPDCGRKVSSRGLCGSHYAAATGAKSTPMGKEGLPYLLPSTRAGGWGKSAKRAKKEVETAPATQARPGAKDGNSSLLILLMILKGADPERFSMIRSSDNEDEVTIVDGENKAAFRVSNIKSVKVVQSRVE
jgi:hypothetical protein